MPAVLFELKTYLERLDNLESVAPTGRKVPSHKELASVCGMSEVSFSRWVNNSREGIPRPELALVIADLRRRGFDVSPADLVIYYP